jgi:hypothetical protein
VEYGERASARGDKVEVADADAMGGEVEYEIVQKAESGVRAKEEDEDVGAGEAGRDEDIKQDGEGEDEEAGRCKDAKSNDQALALHIQHSSLKDMFKPLEKCGTHQENLQKITISYN